MLYLMQIQIRYFWTITSCYIYEVTSLTQQIGNIGNDRHVWDKSLRIMHFQVHEKSVRIY